MPETLMTETAATTTEGQATSQPSAEDPAATAAQETQQPEGQQQQQDDGQQAASDETKDDDKPQGAPESYEFATPDGVELAPDVVAAFGEVAKELDLPQDKAQLVIDKMAPLMAQQQVDVLANLDKAWTEQSRSDPEFGGDKLDENLALVKKAREQFATPEFTKLLNDTRLGNHPEFIRVFVRIGKAISEDRFVGSNSAEVAAKPSPQKLYAASNMNP